MKAYVVFKMIFIFMYLILVLFYIISEILDPRWVSFVRGAGFSCFTWALIKDIADIVKEKPDDKEKQNEQHSH